MSATASLGSPEYHLTSDLNRECLPGANRDPDRIVSWANALCIGVLTVGVLMTKQPAALVFNRQAYDPPPVLPVEETTPPVSEQVTDLKIDNDPQTEEPAASAPLVVVAAEPASVPFAVPVVGATVASFDLRTVSAPPILPVSGSSVTPAPTAAPTSVLRNGERASRGDLPLPSDADYPADAKDHKEVGEVIIVAVVAAEGGFPTEVLIEKSSGSFRLDAHARDWAKTHWKFFPGNPHRWRWVFVYNLPGVSR